MATATNPPTSAPTSTSNKKISPIESAIADLTDFAPLRIFGKRSFAQMRDIFFVLESQKPQAQPIKRKSYLTVGLMPISILANYGLQKVFPNTFGGRRFYNFFIDMIWHTATFLLIVNLNMSFTKHNDFIAFKNNLIKQRNTKYLAYIYENNKKYKINYEDSLENVKLNQSQLINLKLQCEKAAEQLKKQKKQEKKQSSSAVKPQVKPKNEK